MNRKSEPSARAAKPAVTLAFACLAAAVWLSGGLAGGLERLLAPAAHAQPGEIQASQVAASGVLLEGDSARTRFIVDLTGKVDIRVFALADPYRVIVDLPQVAFHFPKGAGQNGHGLVSAYRYGLLAIGRSRIVLDVDQPVSVELAHVLEPQQDSPARLVVDLTPTSRETFMRHLALADDGGADGGKAGGGEPARTAAAAMPVLRPQINEKPVVVIDPGHGGVDPGANGFNGVIEKEIVLAFGMELRDQLGEIGCCIVHMTRETDIFLALRERIAFARSKGASLFVSLHADKFRGGDVRGATVYTLSEQASDAEAAALAKSENRADLIAGLDLDDEPDEVTDILIDLAQRETKNFSVRFAKSLVRGMSGGEVKLNKNPHRFAGFTVLRAPDVPSVLIELGYLSNSHDATQLNDSSWRRQAATSVAKAVARYFRR